MGIGESDLLFIDTLHCHGQVTRELARHHTKIRRYIVLHDTVHFATRSDCIGQNRNRLLQRGWSKGDLYGGIAEAIHIFLEENSHWKTMANFSYNSGLMLLARRA